MVLITSMITFQHSILLIRVLTIMITRTLNSTSSESSSGSSYVLTDHDHYEPKHHPTFPQAGSLCHTPPQGPYVRTEGVRPDQEGDAIRYDVLSVANEVCSDEYDKMINMTTMITRKVVTSICSLCCQRSQSADQ